MIQDEIAADVAQNLQLNLLQPLPKSKPTDPLVLALTQQAKQIEERRGDGTGRKMQQLLDRALEIDPDYVPAHEWMIYAIYFLGVEGDISAEEAADRILRTQENILALEPGNGFVDSSRAWDISEVGEFEKAAVLHARAVAKRPNDSNILRLAGTFARFIGHIDVAMRLAERSTAIDPLCYQCLYQSARPRSIHSVTNAFINLLELLCSPGTMRKPNPCAHASWRSYPTRVAIIIMD